MPDQKRSRHSNRPTRCPSKLTRHRIDQLAWSFPMSWQRSRSPKLRKHPRLKCKVCVRGLNSVRSPLLSKACNLIAKSVSAIRRRQRRGSCNTRKPMTNSRCHNLKCRQSRRSSHSNMQKSSPKSSPKIIRPSTRLCKRPSTREATSPAKSSTITSKNREPCHPLMACLTLTIQALTNPKTRAKLYPTRTLKPLKLTSSTT